MPVSFKLSVLLEDIAEVTKAIEADVSSITLDSREIIAGSLFVALSGTQQHGLAYAKKAQEMGAVAIIWESSDEVVLPVLHIPLIEISNIRDHLGLIADRFYSSPSQSLKLIGITGTDGKTSVSHFIAQALDNTAVIGTIGLGSLDNLKKATHTTPDVLSVHKNLAEMKAQGIKTIAMEVSSHALDQGRVAGVNFDVAVLTNLSRDHLDYHKTVEAYAEAKAKLFTWSSLKTIVVNLDDAFGKKIAEQSELHKNANNRGGVLRRRSAELLGYGIGSVKNYPKGSLVAENSEFTSNGISADVHYGDQSEKLRANVLGRFNLSNLLASLGAMLALDLSLSGALEKLNAVETVAGRMQKVSDADFLAVVDFAHTPNALETVLKALREHTSNKLICVFGCGGDRDAGKRPLMATIVEQNADVVIVTDDNPRTENPQKIMRDIVVGFKQSELVTIEHDRAKAIQMALQQATSGDAVLIAGKGHEKVQILSTGSVPFDDCEQANKVLQELAA